MNRDDQYDEYDDDGRKSKSQRKREMHELQALGEALCALTPEKIRSLDLAPALAEAALFSKTLTSHEARRRHMQYMGRLVREHAGDPDGEEVAALRRALDDLDHRKRAGDAAFHQAEAWRDQLVAGNLDLVEEIAARHPDLDRQHVLTLARNAAREIAWAKPPKAGRALFRYLRDLPAGPADSGAPGPADPADPGNGGTRG